MRVNRDVYDITSESGYDVNKKMKIRHLLSIKNLTLFTLLLTHVHPNSIVHNSSYFSQHVHQAKTNRTQIKESFGAISLYYESSPS